MRWAWNPAVPRLLRQALGIAFAGTVCILVSLVLSLTWAATGRHHGGWLTVAHWLSWCGYGCAAAVWVMALMLWLRKRHRAR